MQLSDILSADRITVSLVGTNKDEVLWALAGLFMEPDQEVVYRALVEREALASTAIGQSVAIPHGRIEGIAAPVAALGVHPRGVPFDAIDGADVRIFVAVISPAGAPGQQLRALARISRLLREPSVRSALLSAPDEAAVHRIVSA